MDKYYLLTASCKRPQIKRSDDTCDNYRPEYTSIQNKQSKFKYNVFSTGLQVPRLGQEHKVCGGFEHICEYSALPHWSAEHSKTKITKQPSLSSFKKLSTAINIKINRNLQLLKKYHIAKLQMIHSSTHR